MLRIVHVGTGLVGAQALRSAIEHPDMELVAVVVSTPEKVGRDAGEIAGVAPVGLAATSSLEDALALSPDVVAYFATSHGRLRETIGEFEQILASGANLVTTSVGALIAPSATRPDVLARLNAACTKGGSTCFSTGVDPGFFSDYLPVVLSGCSRRIDGIRIFEMATYEEFAQSDEVAFDIVGFGTPADTVPPLMDPAGLRATWGGVLGMVGGRNLISIAHVTRARADFAPDWPRPLRGDAYRIIIEGDPRLDCEFEFTSDAGVHIIGGFGITAMRAMNAIPAVVASEPGVKSTFDLPLVTGRGRLS